MSDVPALFLKKNVIISKNNRITKINNVGGFMRCKKKMMSS